MSKDHSFGWAKTLCLLLLFLSTQSAHAIYFKIGGGGTLTQVADSSSLGNYEYRLGYAGGVAFGSSLNPTLNSEIGAYYMQRNYYAEGYSVKSRWFYVPVETRLGFLGLFELGLGVYGAYAASPISATTDNTTKTLTYADLKLRKYDVGATGSFSVSFFSLGLVDLFADARANVSILNAATVDTVRYLDLIGIVGLRIGALK